MDKAVLKLHSVRVPYGARPSDVERAAAAKIGLAGETLPGFRIVRRSLDTRSAPRVLQVYAVEFEGDPRLIARLPANEAAVVEPQPVEPLRPGAQPLGGRILVVGAGPAGLFAALTLAENGYAPIVLERGRPVEERDGDVSRLMESGALNAESNLLFGEGGAGAYSDGKLTTRVGDPRVRRVLEVLVECGAADSVLIDARPHIGSDLLGGIVANIRRRIEASGGSFRFGFKVARLILDSKGSAAGVESDTRETAGASAVILAPGNWADELFAAMYAQGVALKGKPFQAGVRIEHPQEFIDLATYRRRRGNLPPAEYVLSSPPWGRERGVTSFCMCPGGMIVPALAGEGRLSTNGASGSRRRGRFANAALVTTIAQEDCGEGPLAGLEYQSSLERRAFEVAGDYRAPAQLAADFLEGGASGSLPECSYPLGVVSADLGELLPHLITVALRRALVIFERKMRGFVRNGLLVAVESRASSAVRITRDPGTRQSVSTANLYPAGEGAGYAGGIMSSAVDGMKTAESIIARFAPFSPP